MKHNLFFCVLGLFVVAMCISLTACGETGEEEAAIPTSQETNVTTIPGNLEEASVKTFTVLEPETNWPLTEVQLSLVAQANDFAFRLFCALQKPGKSLVLSPLSVDYVLAMTALGADGETRDAIVEALGGATTEPKAMHNLFASLIAYLPSVDENVHINLANAFYLNAGLSGLSINPVYQQVMKNSYLADCKAVKVSEQEGIDYMNAWCNMQTNGFIPEVFPEPLSDETVCLLINALYFKGDWLNLFDSRNTKDFDFKLEDNTSTKVPMMSQRSPFLYMESELFQTVRLPYGKYEDSDAPKPYNLTILLPCEGKTTADILAWLSAKHVADLSQQMKMEEVQIRLPRFETEVRTNLLDVLITLGIPFNDNDLRGFVLCSEKPWGISVSDILQCARIKVNEKGTEAGAVTMDICTSGLPTKTFNADHPFVYLLTERQTGTILFLGTYHGNE